MATAPPIDYARELRAALPADVFAPVPSRLAWLPVHITIVVAATVSVASGLGGWWPAALLVPVIGLSFAGLSLEAYRGNIVLRVVTRMFSFGRNSPLRIVSLVLGFTPQSLHMMVAARSCAELSALRHRVAIAQTLLGIALWTAVALTVGPLAFMFVYVLPLLVANSIVMAYIFTNHGLSSLTEHNDPLLNSLSVTTPRWYGFLTLDFGLHVEHHVVPSISGRHAWRVREVLQSRWPDRYKSMPLCRALGQLLRTARVYRTPTTLHDPWSGREWPTLERAKSET